MGHNPKRTALLIRCSVEEAQQIREAARKQSRTLSGYVLRCLRNRLRIEAELERNIAAMEELRLKRAQDVRS